MPLKDLAVNTAELTEKWVEEIVAPYVNYDIENGRVILLPAAARLSTKKKVLVLLVALQGWPFLSDKEVATNATPAQIGENLNVQGGTLRPVLKDLRDSNFISASGRLHSVSVAALPAIKAAVEESAGQSDSGQRTKSKSTNQRSEKKSRNGARRARTTGGNTEFFNKQISEGFFDEPRVMSDVIARFHESGRIVEKGVVSPLLLKGVKTEKLQRRKAEVKGKTVWVYEAATK